MTALERTAYPRFKRRPSSKELAEVCTPTDEDLVFVRSMARGASPTLTLMVLLKSFGRLGYMPRLQAVPFAIIGDIRSGPACGPTSDTRLDVTAATKVMEQTIDPDGGARFSRSSKACQRTTSRRRRWLTMPA